MKARSFLWTTLACLTVALVVWQILAAAQPPALAHAQLHQYVASASATAARSGSWSDGGTWASGTVPGAGARVAIPAGITVTVDREIATTYDWVRVDGTLRFRPDAATSLIVDTVVAMGRLEMGTAEAPVRPEVTARLIIRSPGTPINHTLDPLELTRGVIAMSPVSIYGTAKKEICALATLPAAGASSLALDCDPTGWAVGDEILVAPTLYGQDEVVKVTALSGRTVSISPALTHTRTNVPKPLAGGPALPMPLKVHVGNMTRNVVIQTDPSQAGDPKLQGHVMLMGGGHRIVNAAFNDLGRTRARNPAINRAMPVTDPIILADGSRDPQLMPLCNGQEENVRGRYSLHFHNPGNDSALSVTEGVVVRVQREKGFKIGIQNHSANVASRRFIVHQIDGSGIFTEEGDEKGEYRDGLVVHSRGSGTSTFINPSSSCVGSNYPAIAATRRHDMGHMGAGIWLQGGMTKIVGNVFAGHDHAGIDHSAMSLSKRVLNTFTVTVPPKEYPASTDPYRSFPAGDWWILESESGPDYIAGKDMDQFFTVDLPPAEITDNHIYAVGQHTYRGSHRAAIVLELQLQREKWRPLPKALIARNVAWNTTNCIDTGYSSWAILRDMACLGGFDGSGFGVNTHRQNGEFWDYTNLRIEGFAGEAFIPSDGSTFTAVHVNGSAYTVATRKGLPIEMCGDGKDNDGDGAIDEGCVFYDPASPATTSPTQPTTAPAAPTNIRIIGGQ